MKERTALSLKLILSHLVLLPIILLISLFVQEDAYLLLSVTQTLLLIIFLAGYWEFFGLKFRIVYACIIQTLIIGFIYYRISTTSFSHDNWVLIFFLGMIQAYLLFELVKIFIVICHRDKLSVEIAFPLKNGKYLITDGGNSKLSRLMNYHYYSPVHKKNRTNNSMRFATDVVKAGASKKLFLPPENTDYAIFSEKVYCPLSGIVIKVENGINDNIPFSGNYPYNTGNTVIIKNNDLYFLLGHLKKGSVLVKPGDSVKENDLLAECGNSGYSERPHIHMQLIHSTTDDYWKGIGVSISYKTRNLYKNRYIRSLYTA